MEFTKALSILQNFTSYEMRYESLAYIRVLENEAMATNGRSLVCIDNLEIPDE